MPGGGPAVDGPEAGAGQLQEQPSERSHSAQPERFYGVTRGTTAKFKAMLGWLGKNHLVGQFDAAAEAARARDRYAIAAYGPEFRSLYKKRLLNYRLQEYEGDAFYRKLFRRDGGEGHPVPLVGFHDPEKAVPTDVDRLWHRLQAFMRANGAAEAQQLPALPALVLLPRGLLLGAVPRALLAQRGLASHASLCRRWGSSLAAGGDAGPRPVRPPSRGVLDAGPARRPRGAPAPPAPEPEQAAEPAGSGPRASCAASRSPPRLVPPPRPDADKTRQGEVNGESEGREGSPEGASAPGGEEAQAGYCRTEPLTPEEIAIAEEEAARDPEQARLLAAAMEAMMADTLKDAPPDQYSLHVYVPSEYPIGSRTFLLYCKVFAEVAARLAPHMQVDGGRAAGAAARRRPALAAPHDAAAACDTGDWEAPPGPEPEIATPPPAAELEQARPGSEGAPSEDCAPPSPGCGPACGSPPPRSWPPPAGSLGYVDVVQKKDGTFRASFVWGEVTRKLRRRATAEEAARDRDRHLLATRGLGAAEGGLLAFPLASYEHEPFFRALFRGEVLPLPTVGIYDSDAQRVHGREVSPGGAVGRGGQEDGKVLPSFQWPDGETRCLPLESSLEAAARAHDRFVIGCWGPEGAPERGLNFDLHLYEQEGWYQRLFMSLPAPPVGANDPDPGSLGAWDRLLAFMTDPGAALWTSMAMEACALERPPAAVPVAPGAAVRRVRGGGLKGVREVGGLFQAQVDFHHRKFKLAPCQSAEEAAREHDRYTIAAVGPANCGRRLNYTLDDYRGERFYRELVESNAAPAFGFRDFTGTDCEDMWDKLKKFMKKCRGAEEAAAATAATGEAGEAGEAGDLGCVFDPSCGAAEGVAGGCEYRGVLVCKNTGRFLPTLDWRGKWRFGWLCRTAKAAAMERDRLAIAAYGPAEARTMSTNFPLDRYKKEPFYRRLFGRKGAREAVGAWDVEADPTDAAAGDAAWERLLAFLDPSLGKGRAPSPSEEPPSGDEAALEEDRSPSPGPTPEPAARRCSPKRGAEAEADAPGEAAASPKRLKVEPVDEGAVPVAVPVPAPAPDPQGPSSALVPVVAPVRIQVRSPDDKRAEAVVVAPGASLREVLQEAGRRLGCALLRLVHIETMKDVEDAAELFRLRPPLFFSIRV
eukprot:tig00000405_g454.t1